MLNSNFDLRKFLAESKAPTEQVNEATLTEATVMEYIREKMDSMNNEVRSCMREYLNAVNEIDPGHEDAHAQLMGALEDFYNKLKAHFEQDAADEDPMPGDEEPPVVLPSDAPSRELDGSPMIEGEEEDDDSFGDEGDAPEVKEGFLDRFKKKPAQSSPAPAKVLSADEIQAMIDAEAKTGTIGDILDDAIVQQTIDLRNATPEQIKTLVSVARKADHGGDTVTGDANMKYLEKLPNYSKVNETVVNEEDELEEEVNEDHSDNPNDKYVVRPCKSKEEPWAVWEGETRVKGFATKEEAQEFADKKNKEQGLDEATINEDDNMLLLQGLAKTVLHLAAVPGFMAVLYKLKDTKKFGPAIQKMITALEKFHD